MISFVGSTSLSLGAAARHVHRTYDQLQTTLQSLTGDDSALSCLVGKGALQRLVSHLQLKSVDPTDKRDCFVGTLDSLSKHVVWVQKRLEEHKAYNSVEAKNKRKHAEVAASRAEPEKKRGKFTPAEEDRLVELHLVHKREWALIKLELQHSFGLNYINIELGPKLRTKTVKAKLENKRKREE